MISVTTTHLRCHHAKVVTGHTETNGCGFVPIKLYLQKLALVLQHECFLVFIYLVPCRWTAGFSPPLPLQGMLQQSCAEIPGTTEAQGGGSDL